MKNNIAIICFISTIFCLCSCRLKTEESVGRWTEIYRDSVFLGIEGEDLDVLFMEAKVSNRVYSRAVERLNKGLHIQGDTLYLDVRNGAEVKVSENIYDYVARMIMHGNRKLKTDTLYEIRQYPATKSYLVIRKDAPPLRK